MLAPNSVCPGQDEANAPLGEQEATMVCLTNYARHAAGKREFRPSDALAAAAGRKSRAIIRCDVFSHFACGMGFSQLSIGIGQGCRRMGENIAWGTGSLGTPRAIFLAWMRSEGHRQNILGHYGLIGVGLGIGSLDGHGAAHVWTQQFGSSCDPAPKMRLKRARAA